MPTIERSTAHSIIVINPGNDGLMIARSAETLPALSADSPQPAREALRTELPRPGNRSNFRKAQFVGGTLLAVGGIATATTGILLHNAKSSVDSVTENPGLAMVTSGAIAATVGFFATVASFMTSHPFSAASQQPQAALPPDPVPLVEIVVVSTDSADSSPVPANASNTPTPDSRGNA